MGKFGRKNVVNLDPSTYIVGLLGESGIGKTTTMYKTCDKLFGEDGYIILDCGKEVGTTCINGVVAEPIENYKKFIEVTDDIIKNKETDYPNLKVVVGDTLDQLFDLAEPYMVKLYNQEHLGEKDFRPAKTINAVEGGFMKGQDRLIDMILDRIFKLRSVGVGFWYTGHVKNRSNDDVFTGESYDMLTTSMAQRYFNAVKNKTHILGIAYIDRSVEVEEYGEENPITKKRKTRNKVTAENRKVKFRDSGYTADSKSRFADITEEITLDTDEFIKAINDAIVSEAGKSDSSKPTKAKKTTPAKEPEPEIEEDEISEPEYEEPVDDADNFDTEDDDIFADEIDEEPFDEEAIKEQIRKLHRTADAETKKLVKEILGTKLNDVHDEETLNKALEALA